VATAPTTQALDQPIRVNAWPSFCTAREQLDTHPGNELPIRSIPGLDAIRRAPGAGASGHPAHVYATDPSVDGSPSAARVIRIAVVEDESLFRDLLRLSLAQHPSIEVVGAFANPEDALHRIPDLGVDVVVLDIDLGASMNGVELGIRLRRAMPTLGLMLLSNHADPQLLSSLPRDVMGGWSYLLKRSVTNVDTLSRAIEGAAMGLLLLDPELTRRTRPRRSGPVSDLSPRQLEVLGLIAEGHSNAAIAARLTLSERSVENHVSRIYTILGVDATDRTAHARVMAVLQYLAGSVTVAN
jgi:DNA-binding NarL/FixJ family response regulator